MYLRRGNRKAELYRQHKRAQLCGKWVLKLHHGALSIIHRTHDFFPFLSVHSKTSQAGKKQVRDGSPYLNSHLHSSSCLIFSLFCKFSVTLLCLVLFFFFPLHLPCAAIIFSLSFYCTVIMILPPNDVFGLKSFWCTQRKALCWVSATTNVTLKHRNAYCIHG